MAELKLGNIKPVGADNVVVEGKYVKGGYVVVATIEERDALKGANGENIVEGSLCFCQADSKFYQYNGTSWIEQTQAATVASNLNTHVNTKTGNPHNVTKANVGLGSVVNTGDSATPVEGGTTKFTTGGAYTELNKKVDKVSGKGLSTNDYTTAEKNKLAGIAEGANKTIIDSSLSSTSTNPVQNKVVKGALDAKANASDLSSHTESTTVHITSDERTNWNAAKTHADSAHAPSNAEKNQNAFSNVAVSGQTTVSADTTTDTLTLVAGNNVTITTDATNDKVTIAAKDTVYTHPTHTAKSSGLYKITVDNEGHVSDTTAVQKSDITALGIPGQDTNTHNSHAIISGKKSDGTTDIKGTASATDITLGDSGVTAGEYGPTSNQTPAYGGTFNVPDIKVNAKGIVTSVTNRTVKIPASDNTDTGATSIEVTGSGNAVTAASYDATNRKITLTKGATYNNYSLPAAGSSLGGVKTGGDVTISSGVITVNDDSHNHVIGNIDGLQDALDAKADDHDHPYVPTSEKGAANGVATLDAGGKVPTAQLPSYVDDVLEYSAKSAFPATGETGKIYVDTTANKTYRWSGSTYTEISASLALGETSSTAYRGDYGKLAYNHSQATSGNPHGVTKSDIGLSNVENKSSATIRSELTQVDVLDALGYTPVDGSDLTNLYEEIQGSKNDDRAHTQTAGQWTLGGLYNWVLDVETAANAAPYVYGDGGIDGTPSYISTTRNTDAGHTEVTLTDQAKDSLAHADVAYSHSQTAHAPSNAEKNQNAFSAVRVTGASIGVYAEAAMDALTLESSNITITTDGTNRKLTFSVDDNGHNHFGYTPSTGLEYDLKYSAGEQFANLKSFGSCADENIVIASTYEGYPVKSIGYGLTSGSIGPLDTVAGKNIHIPSSIVYISGNCHPTNILYFEAENDDGCSFSDSVYSTGCYWGVPNNFMKAHEKYQNKADYALETTSKEIVGAINELSRKTPHVDAAYSHSQASHAPSNAQPNQNAFSNIKVGSTTIAADTTTDTLELVGSNVTVTPDATNDKVTIGITKDNVVSALGYTPPTSDTKYTHPNSGVTAGTYKSVTVNAQGHVTSGSNPTTLAEYGITDAASKNHAHQKYDEVVRYNLHPAAADDNFSYCELTKDTCYIEYMCNEHVHEAISDTIVVPRLSHDGLLVTHIGHTDYVNSCVFNNDAKVVILPDSITTIGAYAFDSCDALGTIAIPDSVRYIEDAAFANCTVLNCLTFGKNSELVSIGERAFLFCRGLTSVVIPKRVTSIGAEAFACCTNLKKVILEGTYTSINLGLGAFGQCESLTDVYLAGPPPVDMDDLYDLFDNQRSITFHFNYSDDFANIADRINKAENIPKAGSTVAGLVKVSSVNNTAVSVNGESTTAGRYYPIELNSDGKIIVNVPWTNTTYSVANATTPGLVKPVSVITKPSLNSVTTTAGKYYQVQMSSDGNMFVNVPWTAYTHPTTAGNKHIPSGGSSGQILKYSSSGTAVWGSVPAATSSSLGGVKISFNATSGVLTITTT